MDASESKKVWNFPHLLRHLCSRKENERSTLAFCILEFWIMDTQPVPTLISSVYYASRLFFLNTFKSMKKRFQTVNARVPHPPMHNAAKQPITKYTLVTQYKWSHHGITHFRFNV